MNMLLHKRTEALLESFVRNPSSSLIVSGAIGSNSSEVVSLICSKLDVNAHTILTVAPEKQSIGVEQIRDLKNLMHTKVEGSKIARIGIIEDAQTLTVESQNALLKLIEEPVPNTLIILHTTDAHSLLATILSRCQILPVLPISKKQAREYGEANAIEEATIAKALALSSGNAELFKDSAHGRDSAMVDRVQSAKEFLSMSVFERLKHVSDYSDKDRLAAHISSLAIIAEAGMHSAKGTSGARRWAHIAALCSQSAETLARHTPAKLVYLRLSTHL